MQPHQQFPQQGGGWVDFGAGDASAQRPPEQPAFITTSTVISARHTAATAVPYSAQYTGYAPQPTGYVPQPTGYVQQQAYQQQYPQYAQQAPQYPGYGGYTGAPPAAGPTGGYPPQQTYAQPGAYAPQQAYAQPGAYPPQQAYAQPGGYAPQAYGYGGQASQGYAAPYGQAQHAAPQQNPPGLTPEQYAATLAAAGAGNAFATLANVAQQAKPQAPASWQAAPPAPQQPAAAGGWTSFGDESPGAGTPAPPPPAAPPAPPAQLAPTFGSTGFGQAGPGFGDAAAFPAQQPPAAFPAAAQPQMPAGYAAPTYAPPPAYAAPPTYAPAPAAQQAPPPQYVNVPAPAAQPASPQMQHLSSFGVPSGQAVAITGMGSGLPPAVGPQPPTPPAAAVAAAAPLAGYRASFDSQRSAHTPVGAAGVVAGEPSNAASQGRHGPSPLGPHAPSHPTPPLSSHVSHVSAHSAAATPHAAALHGFAAAPPAGGPSGAMPPPGGSSVAPPSGAATPAYATGSIPPPHALPSHASVGSAKAPVSPAMSIGAPGTVFLPPGAPASALPAAPAGWSTFDEPASGPALPAAASVAAPATTGVSGTVSGPAPVAPAEWSSFDDAAAAPAAVVPAVAPAAQPAPWSTFDAPDAAPAPHLPFQPPVSGPTGGGLSTVTGGGTPVVLHDYKEPLPEDLFAAPEPPAPPPAPLPAVAPFLASLGLTGRASGGVQTAPSWGQPPAMHSGVGLAPPTGSGNPFADPESLPAAPVGGVEQPLPTYASGAVPAAPVGPSAVEYTVPAGAVPAGWSSFDPAPAVTASAAPAAWSTFDEPAPGAAAPAAQELPVAPVPAAPIAPVTTGAVEAPPATWTSFDDTAEQPPAAAAFAAPSPFPAFADPAAVNAPAVVSEPAPLAVAGAAVQAPAFAEAAPAAAMPGWTSFDADPPAPVAAIAAVAAVEPGTESVPAVGAAPLPEDLFRQASADVAPAVPAVPAHVAPAASVLLPASADSAPVASASAAPVPFPAPVMVDPGVAAALPGWTSFEDTDSAAAAAPIPAAVPPPLPAAVSGGGEAAAALSSHVSGAVPAVVPVVVPSEALPGWTSFEPEPTAAVGAALAPPVVPVDAAVTADVPDGVTSASLAPPQLGGWVSFDDAAGTTDFATPLPVNIAAPDAPTGAAEPSAAAPALAAGPPPPQLQSGVSADPAPAPGTLSGGGTVDVAARTTSSAGGAVVSIVSPRGSTSGPEPLPEDLFAIPFEAAAPAVLAPPASVAYSAPSAAPPADAGLPAGELVVPRGPSDPGVVGVSSGGGATQGWAAFGGDADSEGDSARASFAMGAGTDGNPFAAIMGPALAAAVAFAVPLASAGLPGAADASVAAVPGLPDAAAPPAQVAPVDVPGGAGWTSFEDGPEPDPQSLSPAGIAAAHVTLPPAASLGGVAEPAPGVAGDVAQGDSQTFGAAAPPVSAVGTAGAETVPAPAAEGWVSFGDAGADDAFPAPAAFPVPLTATAVFPAEGGSLSPPAAAFENTAAFPGSAFPSDSAFPVEPAAFTTTSDPPPPAQPPPPELQGSAPAATPPEPAPGLDSSAALAIGGAVPVLGAVLTKAVSRKGDAGSGAGSARTLSPVVSRGPSASDKSALEASLAAAEALHAAQKAAGAGPFFGAGATAYTGEDAGSPSAPVVPAVTAVSAALTSATSSGTLGGRKSSGRLSTSYSGTGAAPAPALTPLRSWQKDEFAPTTQRRSLELGLAAAEATAIARRVSSSKASVEAAAGGTEGLWTACGGLTTAGSGPMPSGPAGAASSAFTALVGAGQSGRSSVPLPSTGSFTSGLNGSAPSRRSAERARASGDMLGGASSGGFMRSAGPSRELSGTPPLPPATHTQATAAAAASPYGTWTSFTDPTAGSQLGAGDAAALEGSGFGGASAFMVDSALSHQGGGGTAGPVGDRVAQLRSTAGGAPSDPGFDVGDASFSWSIAPTATALTAAGVAGIAQQGLEGSEPATGDRHSSGSVGVAAPPEEGEGGQPLPGAEEQGRALDGPQRSGDQESWVMVEDEAQAAVEGGEDTYGGSSAVGHPGVVAAVVVESAAPATPTDNTAGGWESFGADDASPFPTTAFPPSADPAAGFAAEASAVDTTAVPAFQPASFPTDFSADTPPAFPEADFPQDAPFPPVAGSAAGADVPFPPVADSAVAAPAVSGFESVSPPPSWPDAATAVAAVDSAVPDVLSPSQPAAPGWMSFDDPAPFGAAAPGTAAPFAATDAAAAPQAAPGWVPLNAAAPAAQHAPFPGAASGAAEAPGGFGMSGFDSGVGDSGRPFADFSAPLGTVPPMPGADVASPTRAAPPPPPTAAAGVEVASPGASAGAEGSPRAHRLRRPPPLPPAGGAAGSPPPVPPRPAPGTIPPAKTSSSGGVAGAAGAAAIATAAGVAVAATRAPPPPPPISPSASPQGAALGSPAAAGVSSPPPPPPSYDSLFGSKPGPSVASPPAVGTPSPPPVPPRPAQPPGGSGGSGRPAGRAPPPPPPAVVLEAAAAAPVAAATSPTLGGPPPPSYDSVARGGAAAGSPSGVVHAALNAAGEVPLFGWVGAPFGGGDAHIQTPPPPSYEAAMGGYVAPAVLPPPPSYEAVMGAGGDKDRASGGRNKGKVSPPPLTVDRNTGVYFGFRMASDSTHASEATEHSAGPLSPQLSAALEMQKSINSLRSEMATSRQASAGSSVAKAAIAALAASGQDTGGQGVPLIRDPGECLDEQLCVEVRYPPMWPKKAAVLKFLAAGLGNLCAMPGLSGTAMVQWANADTLPGAPEGLQRPQHEDADAAACGAVPAPSSCDQHVTVVAVDEQAGHMWTGHDDGKVCRWSLAPGPRPVRHEQTFRAHNANKVRALAVTPWGDLVTGSSSGIIRLWGNPTAAASCKPPAWSLELKRPGNLRAHGKVLGIAVSASGRTMWSAGTSSLLIWNPHSGACLGAVPLETNKPVRHIDDTGLMWIDPAQGLDPNGVTRAEFRARARAGGGGGGGDTSRDGGAGGSAGHAGPTDEDDGEGEDTTKALQQQVARGVTAVGKFAAKLGKKINKTAANVQKNLAERQAERAAAAAAADSRDAGDESGVVEQQGSRPGERRDKVKALLPLLDTTFIVVYRSGVVDRYTEYGQLLWTRDVRVPTGCAVLVQRWLWLGGADGYIRVLDGVTGDPAPAAATAAAAAGGRRWPAHHSRVKSMTLLGGLVFSLGADGSVKGWPGVQPPPPKALAVWKDGLRAGLRPHKLRVLAGTWNVNCTKASPVSIYDWLVKRMHGVSIVAVALQEVEMGSASVAMDAARSALNKAALERGTAAGQWWADSLQAALNSAGDQFVRVALRQMSGILLVVYVRAALAPAVGEVVTDNVACGVLGLGGNKGAVAISCTLYRRRLVFLSSHFAAHQEKVDERNADYAKIVRGLRLSEAPPARSYGSYAANRGPGGGGGAYTAQRSSSLSGAPTAVAEVEEAGSRTGSPGPIPGGSSSSTPNLTTAGGLGSGTSLTRGALQAGASTPALAAPAGAPQPAGAVLGPGFANADAVIWMGDFNYRVASTYDHVVGRVMVGSLTELVLLDQARQEMTKGHIFHGLAEGGLNFPPTYKFDKGVPGSTACPEDGDGTPRDLSSIPHFGGVALPYDSSEKQRVPAWTDRVFFRGSLPLAGEKGSRPEDVRLSLVQHTPVSYGPGEAEPPAPAYGTVLEVCDSDHKPVYAELELNLPAPDPDKHRKHCMAVLTGVMGEAVPRVAPALRIDLPASQQQQGAAVPVVKLAGRDWHTLRLTNPGLGLAMFSIGGDGGTGANGPRRLPAWLDVWPASGVLPPKGSMEVQLRGAAPEAVFGAGLTAPLPQQEGVLRVYTQHALAAGSGQLRAPPAAEQSPVLLRVVYVPQGSTAGWAAGGGASAGGF